MQYRRFGRTELSMPVFSCGGMRFQKSFKPDADIDEECQDNVEAVARRALELGITHLETARGYGTSELQLGKAIRDLPREQFILQTKVSPKFNVEEFRAEFEKSLRLLGVDRVDLLALHGINDEAAWEKSFDRGSLEAALEFKRQGRARFVGFSTHGPAELVARACATGRFDYVNLHWYYLDPTRWPAVEEAARQDMGVFIISPSDKGGRLYEPPDKLRELCRPLTPMQFNDLYCLARPEVHTLSVGAARPDDFDEHLAGLARANDGDVRLDEIDARLRRAMDDALGADWVAGWREGLPSWRDTPGEINLETIGWLWGLARSLDMIEFGRMRYNLLDNGGSWFPGRKATAFVEGEVTEARIREALGAYRFADRVPDMLREAHAMLGGEERKRLSQS